MLLLAISLTPLFADSTIQEKGTTKWEYKVLTHSNKSPTFRSFLKKIQKNNPVSNRQSYATFKSPLTATLAVALRWEVFDV